MHGAGAPQVKAAAARNLMQGELRSMLERYGRNTPITDPLTALQEHAGKVRAWFDFLEDQVDQLRHSSQWDTEQVNGKVQLFVQAQEMLAKILVDMGKLKIDERLIAIQTAQRDMILEAFKVGLVAGGITGPAPTQAAFAAIGRHLRVIQGGREDDEPRKASGF